MELSGCSETTIAGVATFSGCKIDKAGNGYTLTATDSSDGLNTASAPSSAYNVAAGPLASFSVPTLLGAGQAEIERRWRILLHVAVHFLFFLHAEPFHSLGPQVVTTRATCDFSGLEPVEDGVRFDEEDVRDGE